MIKDDPRVRLAADELVLSVEKAMSRSESASKAAKARWAKHRSANAPGAEEGRMRAGTANVAADLVHSGHNRTAYTDIQLTANNMHDRSKAAGHKPTYAGSFNFYNVAHAHVLKRDILSNDPHAMKRWDKSTLLTAAKQSNLKIPSKNAAGKPLTRQEIIDHIKAKYNPKFDPSGFHQDLAGVNDAWQKEAPQVVFSRADYKVLRPHYMAKVKPVLDKHSHG